MTIALVLAATLGGANPLLGNWVGDGARTASRVTMTITPQAISFGAGRRALGQAPISAFEARAGTVSVLTRLGERYRFHFDDADHICRVPGGGPRIVECFARAPAAA